MGFCQQRRSDPQDGDKTLAALRRRSRDEEHPFFFPDVLVYDVRCEHRRGFLRVAFPPSNAAALPTPISHDDI